MKSLLFRRLTCFRFSSGIVLAVALTLVSASARAGETAARPRLSGNIQIQTTVFKVTGSQLPLSLLTMSRPDDEALFRKLAGMVAEGGAELIADHHFTAPSVPETAPETISEDPFGDRARRETRGESTKETPYPTEYASQRRGTEMVPEAWEYKNSGISTVARMELVPLSPHTASAAASAGVSGELSVEQIRGDQLLDWPVSLPGAPADGSLDMTQFLTDSTEGFVRSADSLHHLLSMGRRAGETLGTNEEYSFTFFKAVPENKSLQAHLQGSGSVSGLLRLHGLAFDLPAAAGLDFLRKRREDADDAALLDALLQASKNKTVELKEHAMVLVDSRKPVIIPEPTVGAYEDPFALPASAMQYSARLERVEEFMWPTDYSEDLLPQSFEFANLGRRFQVSVLKAAAVTGETELAIRLEMASAPRLLSWPAAAESGPRPPVVHMPAFPSTVLRAELTVRPGGVYCLGAITLPSFFQEPATGASRMRISLLKVLPDGADTAGATVSPATARTSPQPEIYGEVLSLNPTDAALLKALDSLPKEAEALLRQLTETGTAHCIAWSQVAGKARLEQNLSISAEVNTPCPRGCIRTKADFLLPTKFELGHIGFRLRLSGQNQEGKREPSVDIMMHHATLLQPGLAQLEQAADGKEKLIPEPKRFHIEGAQPFRKDAAPFQILCLAPANVPPGHPEAGRWHAAVLRVTGR